MGAPNENYKFVTWTSATALFTQLGKSIGYR